MEFQSLPASERTDGTSAPSFSGGAPGGFVLAHQGNPSQRPRPKGTVGISAIWL